MSDPEPFDLIAFSAEIEAANRPKRFTIRHPMTGEETGFVFWVAGPYSKEQDAARAWVQSEATKLRATHQGIPSEARESLAVGQLARCVTDWSMREHGVSIPFTLANVARVLGASRAIREQVDEFAAFGPHWVTRTAESSDAA